MKLALRVLAFSLCLIATYSTANLATTLAAGPKPSAPMPMCPPSSPTCTL